MSRVLQKAFEEASKLPDKEQEALGEWLLEELASERRWEKLLSGSPEKLAQLGNEALAEYRARQTQDLDADRL